MRKRLNSPPRHGMRSVQRDAVLGSRRLQTEEEGPPATELSQLFAERPSLSSASSTLCTEQAISNWKNTSLGARTALQTANSRSPCSRGWRRTGSQSLMDSIRRTSSSMLWRTSLFNFSSDPRTAPMMRSLSEMLAAEHWRMSMTSIFWRMLRKRPLLMVGARTSILILFMVQMYISYRHQTRSSGRSLSSRTRNSRLACRSA
mmetsp:Transcript_76853/g.197916  ORF Transcript_76853/g.197916 Transcript_76853/m.197916 type:complete len:203 (+) Transcript_76853:123-731(+)